MAKMDMERFASKLFVSGPIIKFLGAKGLQGVKCHKPPVLYFKLRENFIWKWN